MSFFIIACASEPVKVDLPANHPANPQSQGTAFIPPPNPFQGHMQMETVGSTPTTQNKQIPAHQHQMGKESVPTTKSNMEMEDHDHKEHKK
jgi:hypothetical protein